MRFQWKGFTSLLLSLLFVAIAFSGVILYVTPRGRVANWTGWTIFGLQKQSWQAIHINIGLLFLLATVLHLVLNWGMFWGYIKKKANLALNLKVEMAVALVLAGGVLLGTIWRTAPFGVLMTFNERIKDYWEQEPLTAPTPHAEEQTVRQLADRAGLAVDRLIAALKDEGVSVDDANATIAQLAERNQRTPSELYTGLRKRLPELPGPGLGRGMGGGLGPGRGQGRGMGMRAWE